MGVFACQRYQEIEARILFLLESFKLHSIHSFSAVAGNFLN